MVNRVIEVNGVAKQFGEVSALERATFTARDGEITGLLGPNGAGKTTCLRLIYGLLAADDGWARVDGIDVGAEPLEARRRLGIFPDRVGGYPRLTARETIDYFAGLHGLDRRARREAIARIADELELGDIIDRRTQGFSQGQRMKVALASCLVHQPRNLLLDEPTRGLDVMASRMLRDYLRSQREAGRCIVFSSHAMAEVAELCDRVVIIAGGRVVADGTPADLCERAGKDHFEQAFVEIIGTTEGLLA